MAYSNVTPPILPTYDAETYGFYLLVFNYELGAENWYMCYLIYGAWRFQYDEGIGITNTGNTFTRTYSDGTWSEELQNTETLTLNPGVHGSVYQRIYTNANIFNGDEIWLAENTVTPLDEEQRQINIKSKLAGLIMAWCAPVRQFPRREPVAFLYGHVAKEGETPTHTINGVDYVGVVAPDIFKVYTPELQKEYPYVVISQFTMLYYLTFYSAPVYCENNVFGCSYKSNNVCSAIAYTFLPEQGDTAWNPNDDNSATDVAVGEPIGHAAFPLWANFGLPKTLITTGETIYIAASEPVPIYE